MSGRPNLSEAFAPVSAPARGAALQGLLAPKRRNSSAQPVEPKEQPEKPERFESPTPDPGQVLITPDTNSEAASAHSLDLTSKKEPENNGTDGAESVSVVPRARRSGGRPRPVAAQDASSGKKASETVAGGLRNVGVYLPPSLLAAVKDAVHQARTTYAELLIDAFEVLDEGEISSEFAVETVMTTSGMPRRTSRKRGEAGIQIQLRLDGLQVAWLDEKVVELDAPSRSALVSAVFRLYVAAQHPSKD